MLTTVGFLVIDPPGEHGECATTQTLFSAPEQQVEGHGVRGHPRLLHSEEGLQRLFPAATEAEVKHRSGEPEDNAGNN